MAATRRNASWSARAQQERRIKARFAQGLPYRQIVQHGEAVAKSLMPQIDISLGAQTSDILTRMRQEFPALTAPLAVSPPPRAAAVVQDAPAPVIAEPDVKANAKAAKADAKAAAKEARQAKALMQAKAKAKAKAEAELDRALARARAAGVATRTAVLE